MLAEGHAIDCAAVDKKRRILDDLSIDAVLDMSDGWSNAEVSTKSFDADWFGSATTSNACRAAASRKDRQAVDRPILDALGLNHSKYGRVLDAEECMQAFTGRLCAEVETAHAAYRWMDPPELESTWAERSRAGSRTIARGAASRR